MPPANQESVQGSASSVKAPKAAEMAQATRIHIGRPTKVTRTGAATKERKEMAAPDTASTKHQNLEAKYKQPQPLQATKNGHTTTSAEHKQGWTQKDIEACLRQHNDLRRAHGVPPLKWMDSLARGAQAAAEHKQGWTQKDIEA